MDSPFLEIFKSKVDLFFLNGSVLVEKEFFGGRFRARARQEVRLGVYEDPLWF